MIRYKASRRDLFERLECAVLKPRFLAFSTHYEFRPLAVRRGHPNDKPRTERSFWEDVAKTRAAERAAA